MLAIVEQSFVIFVTLETDNDEDSTYFVIYAGAEFKIFDIPYVINI